jgi:hypothetical protein
LVCAATEADLVCAASTLSLSSQALATKSY